MNMAVISPYPTFQHPYVGSLLIENGIDAAEWAYGLNTATFPTYGGEVVQILSVYIDSLTLSGTVATYTQLETIYEYFTQYLQVLTQSGSSSIATNQGQSGAGGAYNLKKMTFTYPTRNWKFQVYPTEVPQFHLGFDVIAPTWQVTFFVIDNSPDLSLVKDGILQAVTSTVDQQAPSGGTMITDLNTFNLTGNISPNSSNPNTDPFQTYDTGAAAATKTIGQYADYFNSLIPSYSAGDFSSLTGEFGSSPNFGKTKNQKSKSNTVTEKPGKKTK
jgi:hypothetical protein